MLIILGKSPLAENNSSILEIAAKTVENGEKTAVLHIQDACVAVTMNEYCDKLFENRIDVYALKADCEARGLMNRLRPRVKVIDYRLWVTLVMMAHDKIVSWII